MCISKLNSLRFSIVCLMTNTLLIHDLPFLKPFCSSSTIVSDMVYCIFLSFNNCVPFSQMVVDIYTVTCSIYIKTQLCYTECLILLCLIF
jgi:hypothetical protein